MGKTPPNDDTIPFKTHLLPTESSVHRSVKCVANRSNAASDTTPRSLNPARADNSIDCRGRVSAAASLAFHLASQDRKPSSQSLLDG